jgi:hypothetical protein
MVINGRVNSHVVKTTFASGNTYASADQYEIKRSKTMITPMSRLTTSLWLSLRKQSIGHWLPKDMGFPFLSVIPIPIIRQWLGGEQKLA